MACSRCKISTYIPKCIVGTGCALLCEVLICFYIWFQFGGRVLRYPVPEWLLLPGSFTVIFVKSEWSELIQDLDLHWGTFSQTVWLIGYDWSAPVNNLLLCCKKKSYTTWILTFCGCFTENSPLWSLMLRPLLYLLACAKKHNHTHTNPPTHPPTHTHTPTHTFSTAAWQELDAQLLSESSSLIRRTSVRTEKSHETRP